MRTSRIKKALSLIMMISVGARVSRSSQGLHMKKSRSISMTNLKNKIYLELYRCNLTQIVDFTKIVLS